MKLYPVTILAAFSCIVVVSAAPSTPIDSPIQIGWEFPKDLPWAKYYDCLINLLGEISKANGEAKTWSIHQSELLNNVNDWKKCYEGDRTDFDSCHEREGQATYAVVKKYMELIAKKNPAVLKEFFAKQGKCYTDDSEFQYLLSNDNQLAPNKDEELDVFGWEMPKDFPWAKYLECYVNFVDQISKDFQLEEMWVPYRSQVRIHIKEWKKCTKPGNKDSVGCNELEGIATFKLLDEYLRTLYSVKPEAFRTFMRELPRKCQNIQ